MAGELLLSTPNCTPMFSATFNSLLASRFQLLAVRGLPLFFILMMIPVGVAVLFLAGISFASAQRERAIF